MTQPRHTTNTITDTQLDHLYARLDTAEATVDRIRDLHQNATIARDLVFTDDPRHPTEVRPVNGCQHCRAPWPCQTIAALDQDQAAAQPRTGTTHHTRTKGTHQ